MLRALVATLLCLSTFDARSDGGADALVEKVLAAYGGRTALERARVVRQEGTVTSLMHGGEGTLVRLFERPASLRVEIAYPGDAPEIRVVHAGYGDRNGIEVTGSPAHGAMLLQAARLALPLSLAQRGASIVERDAVERGGKRARVLSLALGPGLELTVEVDPASGLIVRSSGSMSTPAGRIEFATEYSDFRRFGEVLFATHEENFARGHHTGATTLVKIDLLSRAPAGAFDEPL